MVADGNPRPGANWAGCTETHVSAVYFLGDKVLKVKKPVRNDFLDFSTIEARHRACLDEVRLNRRLSPDIYLGVAEIDLGDCCVEPAVVMRRLDDRDGLAVLLGREPDRVRCAVEEVVLKVAALHTATPPAVGDTSPGSWRRVIAQWRKEWAALERLNPAFSPDQRRGAAYQLGLRYMNGRRLLFDRRVRDGRIRDGHGDLRVDHVYVTSSGVRIVDCLEFDADLRACDVVADFAFLAMDLERLDEPAVADQLWAVYRDHTGDDYPSSLAHFYVAQRALVRLKVVLMSPRPRTRAAVAEEDRLLDLAEAHLVAAQPTMTCIGGLPGSGKSTLASALAVRHDLVYLSTDAIRHEGRESDERSPWGAGRYTESAVAAVYAELLSRARTALGSGYSVVLDASWRDSAHRRQAAAIAEEAGAILSEIACEVDDVTAAERLRGSRPGFSEAGMAERRAMRAGFAPWPTATVVSTTGDASESLDKAAALLRSTTQATLEGAQLCKVAATDPAAASQVDDD
jgi:aminoglycoside phosphotransferase family enzyme/predicted kinase